MQSWPIGPDIPVTVISDHKNLTYFMQSCTLNHQQTHWSMFLADFNFKLDWLPGSKNTTDFPSRCLDYKPKEGDTLDSQPILTELHLEHLYPHYIQPSTSSLPNQLSALWNNLWWTLQMLMLLWMLLPVFVSTRNSSLPFLHTTQNSIPQLHSCWDCLLQHPTHSCNIICSKWKHLARLI